MCIFIDYEERRYGLVWTGGHRITKTVSKETEKLHFIMNKYSEFFTISSIKIKSL